jgi:hypothetical protein
MMASYLLLYSGGSMPETPEEQAAVMQAWTHWFTNLGSALIDGGNPFSGAVKSLNRNGVVSNNAASLQASGYSIIQANSLDEAVELASGCPVLQGGAQITVFETFQVM